jgi:hypothetical protein
MSAEVRTVTLALPPATHPVESYPLTMALLDAMGTGQEGDPPLGITTRIGTQNSDFNVAAHPLRAILVHSPSPSAVANDCLTELGKCWITAETEPDEIVKSTPSAPIVQ